MNELNSNDLPYLPDEILTKIFKLLDVRSLKNATLACTRWHQLIESECRWSLRVAYTFQGELLHKRSSYYITEEKMNFILTTNRRFGEIEIRDGHLCEDCQIVKMFERHGSNVLRLTLVDGRINSLNAFAKILNFTPNLKYAKMLQVAVHDANDLPLDQALRYLRRLKHLDIGASDSRLMKCFLNAQPEAFAERAWYRAPLIDFLSSQLMLKSLTTIDREGPYALNPTNHDNLLKFLKSQTESVEELRLGPGTPSTVYEFVFANMNRVHTLSSSVGGMFRQNVFIERLKENWSVRAIRLDLFIMDVINVGWVRKFLSKLPNIRNFSSVYVDRKFFEEQTLSKIKSLHVDRFMKWEIDFSKFSNLKVLQIGLLNVKINWNKFTKIHSRLTELTIEELDESCYFTSDDIDHITNKADLQIIRVGPGFVADDRFFDIVRLKCKNLKVLDLHTSCLSDGLRHKVNSSVLRLCDDIVCSPMFS